MLRVIGRSRGCDSKIGNPLVRVAPPDRVSPSRPDTLDPPMLRVSPVDVRGNLAVGLVAPVRRLQVESSLYDTFVSCLLSEWCAAKAASALVLYGAGKINGPNADKDFVRLRLRSSADLACSGTAYVERIRTRSEEKIARVRTAVMAEFRSDKCEQNHCRITVCVGDERAKPEQMVVASMINVLIASSAPTELFTQAPQLWAHICWR